MALTPAQARQQAQQLIKQEKNTGPAWAPIIKALGYDPRQGYGKTTGLNFSQKWQNQSKNPKPEPQPKPAAPKAAPPKPAPAPKPQPPARSYDSVYTAQMGGSKAMHDVEMAGIGLGRNRLGYDTGYNYNSATGKVEVDLRNSYSQAMLLQRHYDQSLRGTSASMAARGQLYSGARQSALSEVTHGFNVESDRLQLGALRGGQDFDLQQQAAGAERNVRETDIYANQAGRWVDNENEWYRRFG
jgi:hypothetical protein